MEGFLTITALARKTRVSSKALRYWEGLGLLPKASRSHCGYRMFPAGAVAYVEFVRRSKDMGLTLRQMKTVLKLARKGHSPCSQVETFIASRIAELDAQIEALSKLRQSLLAIQQCEVDSARCADRASQCCSLLVDLPEGKPFRREASPGR